MRLIPLPDAGGDPRARHAFSTPLGTTGAERAVAPSRSRISAMQAIAIRGP